MCCGVLCFQEIEMRRLVQVSNPIGKEEFNEDLWMRRIQVIKETNCDMVCKHEPHVSVRQGTGASTSQIKW